MVEIRQYIPDDYMKMQRRKFDMLTYLCFPDPRSMAMRLMRGLAMTGLADGEIIACGGIVPIWKGVGEAWIVSSPLVQRFPFSFAKVIWRKLPIFSTILELERVQTTVDTEHTVSIGWVERMGFVREGVMRKYLGGRDFYRYALIKEESDAASRTYNSRGSVSSVDSLQRL